MNRRLIAAFALASLVWGSVPFAAASSTRQPVRHSSAMARDHSCCPGLHSGSAPAIIVNVAPAEMPCGDEHPCCAKQAPDHPLSLPIATSTARPDSAGLQATLPGQSPEGTRTAAKLSASDLIQSCSARSTVLRI